MAICVIAVVGDARWSFRGKHLIDLYGAREVLRRSLRRGMRSIPDDLDLLPRGGLGSAGCRHNQADDRNQARLHRVTPDVG